MSPFGSAAAIALIAILSPFVVALFRTIATSKPRPKRRPLGQPALEEAAGVEDALATVIRRPTVSWFDYAQADKAAFDGLGSDLVKLFPKVHASLDRKEIGDWGLLYEWRGSDSSLAPVILCSHFDVVPAEDAEFWSHPPFSGHLDDGYVWGRGAQDVKCSLVSILHAAERLLASDFRPKRTLYFAFGGDEEVGGPRGAGALGGWLASQAIRASFILDEGAPVSVGIFDFADRPLALVGVAEKGYIDVALRAHGKGGHASMPPRESATGAIARAVAAIERGRPPARLTRTVRGFLEGLAPYAPFGARLLFKNLWLFAPLVKFVFGGSPTTNALIRTTIAPTMLEGSAKENVLADSAKAVVNVRILPGESSALVLDRLARATDGFGVEVAPAHEGLTVEPLPESPIDHEGYRAIEGALAAAFPEAACVPYLFSASTDTKHYRDLADAMYRLTPLLQTRTDMEGVHGRDERVAIDNLRRCELFYKSLIASL